MKYITYYEEYFKGKILNVAKHKVLCNVHLINKEKHKKTLLTYAQVCAIREDWIKSNGTLHQTNLAKEYGVSLSTMHNIIHNKKWYDPEYLPCKTSKITNGKLDTSLIETIRLNYRNFPKPRPTYKAYAQNYEISGVHMGTILKGNIYKDKKGPILGKDYK